ncbi:hypothetical protein JMJ77_0008736 [Colletotrichum scovillei]|uniref:Uncharacterized protein n=1 Tax=Colletotrichum scovillei TaxID=1209932 RepID=A0A9P7QVG3_9PEZI|nr:hypothetical protein JMJ78_0001592 [Colletotrichum scovillei]KAG7041031.1 hypothetical protein JMJ77_0008736 [Colletotrichum scovillei]KAG7061064.1 hypothetical protein JMJ76_0010134 [Colletotrichum scovillei]
MEIQIPVKIHTDRCITEQVIAGPSYSIDTRHPGLFLGEYRRVKTFFVCMFLVDPCSRVKTADPAPGSCNR